MHLSYGAQLRAKRERMRRALAGADVAEIVGAPDALGYRGTAKYVVVRRGGKAVLGSYAPRTHRVADMSGCLVARPPIPEVAAEIARLCDEIGGTPRYVVIRCEDASLHVALVAWQEDPRFLAMARELRRRRPVVAGVSLLVNPSKGNVILAGEEIVLEGAARSPRRFRQANRDQAERLYEEVVAAAAIRDGETAFDLYCGAGAIAERLATTYPGARIVAVDRVPAEPRGARFVKADVADFLAEASHAQVVVANPPRKGLGEAVCRSLARTATARLVYVSCVPESFARDWRRLESLFSLERVRPYDLLPQTPHVEMVALLRRRVF